MFHLKLTSLAAVAPGTWHRALRALRASLWRSSSDLLSTARRKGAGRPPRSEAATWPEGDRAIGATPKKERASTKGPHASKKTRMELCQIQPFWRSACTHTQQNFIISELAQDHHKSKNESWLPNSLTWLGCGLPLFRLNPFCGNCLLSFCGLLFGPKQATREMLVGNTLSFQLTYHCNSKHLVGANERAYYASGRLSGLHKSQGILKCFRSQTKSQKAPG